MDDSEESFKWTSLAVATLIEQIKLYWDDFHNSLKKKKCVWDEISKKMSIHGYYVSSIECDKKFRNIKARYQLALENKVLRKKKMSRIEYFDELDNLLGSHPNTLAKLEQRKLELDQEDRKKKALIEHNVAKDSIINNMDVNEGEEWSNDEIVNFLSLLKEFKDCFSDPLEVSISVDIIWEVVSEHMNMKGFFYGPDACRKQWQVLVQTFNFLKESDAKQDWPYFAMIEDAILTVPIPISSMKRKLSNIGSNHLKKIIKSESLDQMKPCTSIKIESVDDEDRDDESRAKFLQLSGAINQLEYSFLNWKDLSKLGGIIDNKLDDYQKTLEETNVILSKTLSEATSLCINLSKKFPNPVKEEDFTLILPTNNENT